MTRRILAIAILSAATLLGAAEPDLSGTWLLNLSKSDFGMMQAQAPTKLERTVVHEGGSLKFTTRQSGSRGEVVTRMSYTTDGKASVNKTARGEITGSAKWDGAVLVIASKREINGATITQTERWTLAQGGKTLTIINKVEMPAGETEARLVFEKQ